jgi:hypothetical protein
MDRNKLRQDLQSERGFLSSEFPPDQRDYGLSSWAMWENRVKSGGQEELDRWEDEARCGIGPDVQEAWIEDQNSLTEELSNAMSACIVVVLWSRVEALFERTCRSLAQHGALTAPQAFRFAEVGKFMRSNCGIQLEHLPCFDEVNAIRLLNNCFKHKDGGTYTPPVNRPGDTISPALLSRWGAIDANGRLNYRAVPVSELTAACFSFCSELLTRIESHYP